MVKGIETTYKDFTRRTARYPKRREKEYLMLGLMNEAGEVGGAYKKEIRDRVDNTELIIDELGDVNADGVINILDVVILVNWVLYEDD